MSDGKKIFLLGWLVFFCAGVFIKSEECEICRKFYGRSNYCDHCDRCKESKKNKENEEFNRAVRVEEARQRAAKAEVDRKAKEEKAKRDALVIEQNRKNEELKKQIEETKKQLVQLKKERIAEAKAELLQQKKRDEEFRKAEEKRKKEEKLEQENFEKAQKIINEMDMDLYESIVNGDVDFKDVALSNPALSNPIVIDRLNQIKKVRDGVKVAEKVMAQKPQDNEVQNVSALINDFASKVEYESNKAKDNFVNAQRVREMAQSVGNLDKTESIGYKFADRSISRMTDVSQGGDFNQLQQYVRLEYMGKYSQTLNLEQEFKENLQIRNIAQIACKALDNGSDYIRTKEYKEAFNVVDTGEKLLEVGRKIGDYITEGRDFIFGGIEKGAKNVDEGFEYLKTKLRMNADESMQCIEGAREASSNKYALEDGEVGVEVSLGLELSVCDIACTTAKVVGALANSMRPLNAKLADIKKATDEASLSLARDMLNATRPHPLADGISMVASSIIEGELIGAAIYPFVSSAVEFLAPLVKTAIQEVAIAKAALLDGFEVLTPVNDILKGAGEGAKVAQKIVEEKGIGFAENVLDIVERNPNLIKTEGSAGKAINKVSNIETKLEKNNLFDLLEKAKPREKVSHQLEVMADDQTKVIFRRGTGARAHSIGNKYPKPVDHYNIEIQEAIAKDDYIPIYDQHIIIEDGNVHSFGKGKNHYKHLKSDKMYK
ncbi:TPA: hypothetical protein DEO28_01530 [Candidatus Dependentiae bacterium]|nr:MAG: hypothetical protein UR14_C0003G0153 [candidate division TM6 bacterium GW2011_GWE2_31_21]KKP53683.1 MAG: hypothetical protein UR43_C0003G0004 [candidate division TM6 bacterium GW2011_GWF2_33_332]HBS48565.1 hypothetical protein [Candidatus Dependentiae bacterium]HBZ73180.1 hypothetical protein [Candidatus Dependentiae bacterium]